MPNASAARGRLLETAAELFYAEGITATGVDRIVAEAGVAKPTLYAHFSSKAALITAVLEERHHRQRASLEEYLSQCGGTPAEQLLAVFDWLGAWQAGLGTRGCAFVNAAAELTGPSDPARAVIVEHKRWLRGQLTRLATEAHLANAGELGEELLLLIEGATTRMLVEGDREAAARAGRAAQTLVNAAQKLVNGRQVKHASG